MAWPRWRRSCLREGQPLSGGDADLPLHQVQPGDQLGDRVLHLQAGVHLQEVEAGAFRDRR